MELQVVAFGGLVTMSQVKVVLVGQMMSGKTSLMIRFVRGIFSDNSGCTVFSGFLTKTMDVDQTLVKYEIWDTAGAEFYRSIQPLFYRGAHAAIVAYDIANYESYRRAKKFVTELRNLLGTKVVIALAGNKCDLYKYRDVCFERATRYAEENDLIFMETSAKTGENVHEMFKAIGARFPLDPNREERYGFILQGHSIEERERENRCCHM